MEAQFVLIASTVGSVVSVILLVDAWQDRNFVCEHYDKDDALVALTEYRLKSEWFRLLAQLLFLVIAISVAVDFPPFREFALYLLLLVPILLAGWSIYSWAWRRQILKTQGS